MSCIHHVALRVLDPARAAAFYSRVLGLALVERQEDERGPGSVWLRAGDVVLMLERRLRGGGAETGSGHVLVFATPDLASAEERLLREGTRVEDRTAHTLYFHDPDGHCVGLSDFSFDPAGS